MKTKTSKQPKQSKAAVQLKDIRPKKDAKAGTGYHTGGVNVALGDGSVRF
jgi:prepilin-type processing-associated H-X9-DG protein